MESCTEGAGLTITAMWKTAEQVRFATLFAIDGRRKMAGPNILVRPPVLDYCEVVSLLSYDPEGLH